MQLSLFGFIEIGHSIPSTVRENKKRPFVIKNRRWSPGGQTHRAPAVVVPENRDTATVNCRKTGSLRLAVPGLQGDNCKSSTGVSPVANPDPMAGTAMLRVRSRPRPHAVCGIRVRTTHCRHSARSEAEARNPRAVAMVPQPARGCLDPATLAQGDEGPGYRHREMLADGMANRDTATVNCRKAGSLRNGSPRFEFAEWRSPVCGLRLAIPGARFAVCGWRCPFRPQKWLLRVQQECLLSRKHPNITRRILP